jgi:hypothetical protein
VRKTIVRYETKPDRAEENKRLIENVFAELATVAPEGFAYASFQLDDGVSFIHVATETGEGEFRLPDLATFKEFTAGIAERCNVQPNASGATVVGSYRSFEE